ncbi:hypothetical protein OMW55_00520 [Sphingomonas sp. BN140010]|uniref:Sugar transporter n=1 Tax=Sphingomonas arvum TaxID=2992113 RepID=A0ABT3JBI2_9SPHN|nr:hypothetical protein [Sphingomonas sp. BN140010]MCW3796294.1 hypothetical protein [Sphingomonas sp. BN140010]
MSDTVLHDPGISTGQARPAGPRRTPWHLWAVGIVALLWNGFGAVDYLMTRTRNEAYLGQMGDPQVILNYIDAFPTWASIGWGLAVWGAVAGSLLLLLRSRHAVTAFALSLMGMALSFGWQYLGPPPPPVMTEGPNAVMPILIAVAAVLFLAYAGRALTRGLLR